jgi:hypothetical protein
VTKKTKLIIGDIIAIAIVTIIGFATHGEAGVSFIPRMGTILFPFLLGWFILAPWFGLFDEQIISDPKLLWRILLTMLFVAPLAAILRSVLLHNAAQPIFVLILGLTNALGMLVWRGVYLFVTQRNK